MAFFKKKTIVGVSINPELGIEVAQVDFATRTVLKYGVTPLQYDHNRREIADMDAFRGTIEELLSSLGIPKGTNIALNMPSVVFKVADYPAHYNSTELMGIFEEELMKHPIFQDHDPLIDAVSLTTTAQFRKVAYTALQKTAMIEMAMYFKSIGYPVISIDTSVNSTLNALVYNQKVGTSADNSWVMIQVDNAYARILAMQGNVYTESVEERVSIGAVLGDEENYATVVSAIQPYLTRLPAKRLLIVSKTDIISAEVLANQLKFAGEVLHLEANSFANAPFLSIGPSVGEEAAKTISLDVIGAAISYEFQPYSATPMNLFNSSLGSIYDDEQPLSFGSLILSLENCFVGAIIVSLLMFAIAAVVYLPLQKEKESLNEKLSKINSEISIIDAYLKENDWVSTSKFNEADEIRSGLLHNKNVYSNYTIVGTEIPKKLWLTNLDLGNVTTIKGQADNIESVYSFYRNLNDYSAASGLTLKKLALASSSNLTELTEDGEFDANSVLNSMEADFYEFEISNGSGEDSKKTPQGLPSELLKLN